MGPYVDNLINEIKLLQKAPPGPKPSHFGPDVDWNEEKRRWTLPSKGSSKGKPSKVKKPKGPKKGIGEKDAQSEDRTYATEAKPVQSDDDRIKVPDNETQHYFGGVTA